MRAYSQEALERNLRLGLTDAVDRWFEPSRASPAPDLHFALGRAQARSGRGLDELMGFYRIAGQEKLVDIEGRVDKFKARQEAAKKAKEARAAAKPKSAKKSQKEAQKLGETKSA